jgi:hypothetical protein
MGATVADVMSRDVEFIAGDAPVPEAAVLMGEHQVEGGAQGIALGAGHDRARHRLAHPDRARIEPRCCSAATRSRPRSSV